MSPTEIWPSMTWKDVTSDYAGLFFRAEGGGSIAFGVEQPQNSNRLLNYETGSYLGHQPSTSNFSVIPGNVGGWAYTGPYDYGNSKDWTGIRFLISSGEVRPRNKAMRIWKRIK
ncbi:unnamed protein product [Sphagnum jensenii]|uniref:Uncharacterized protein n=1 Tax=Sphagnum jensenii TaxID=128206 RepID=A0ABP0VAI8_9BRYO